MSKKDVHTEHCCIRHGCCYRITHEDKCTVIDGGVKQSFRCEFCDSDIEEYWAWAHLMNEMFERGRLAR